MKKILLLLITATFALTACGAFPAQAPQPTPIPPTPQVIIATVLVPVEVTSVVTAVPLPTNTLVVAPSTEVPPALPPATASTELVPVTGGPIAVDPKFNGQSLEKITVSNNKFSLNCSPKEITFDVYSTDIYIVRTDMYYRIRDRHSNDIPSWSIAGTMDTDGLNHFWMTMKGEGVPPDLRQAQGAFDFQFIGLNKLGNVVGRSEKITDIVSYTINC